MTLQETRVYAGTRRRETTSAALSYGEVTSYLECQYDSTRDQGLCRYQEKRDGECCAVVWRRETASAALSSGEVTSYLECQYDSTRDQGLCRYQEKRDGECCAVVW
ncbi:hypothetical protein J6590_090051 [Homalodisca vitripennis]|nr:hypothetical protein J6590_090051 [Homalodisca vitripennis]